MKKILLTLIMILFPISIFASGDVTVDKTSISVEAGSSDSFTITSNNARGEISIVSSNSSIVSLNKDSWIIENINEDEIKTETITVTGNSVGSAYITLNINATTLDGENINTSKTIAVNVSERKSSNANISDIKIDDVSIVGFNPDILTYNISTEKDRVAISVTVEEHATVDPNYGVQELKYGVNKFSLKVTAEDGTTKNYLLNITRIDNRDTNNYLKSLSVSQGELNFNKNTTSYQVKLESEITSINISAEAESEKATIIGDGIKSLAITNNVFEITVIAENESERKYTITIIRNNEYVITYNSNGGTKCSPDSVAVTKGTKIGALCKTSRSGYNLSGWYTESSGGTKVTANTIADRSFTIYAQWVKKSTTSNPDTGIETPIITILVIILASLGIYFIVKNRNISFD